MANQPAVHPELALHLTDRSLTSLISSAKLVSDVDTQSQLQALTTLTNLAVSSYDSALRLGLGLPRRMMVETSGPAILHAYLNPQSPLQQAESELDGRERDILQQTRGDMRPLSGTTENSSTTEQSGRDEDADGALIDSEAGTDTELDNERLQKEPRLPPLLIAIVVAPCTSEAGEARKAAVRLEAMGRSFQRQWIQEHEQQGAQEAQAGAPDG